MIRLNQAAVERELPPSGAPALDFGSYSEGQMRKMKVLVSGPGESQPKFLYVNWHEVSAAANLMSSC